MQGFLGRFALPGCIAAMKWLLGRSDWSGNFCFFKIWVFNAFIFEKKLKNGGAIY